MSVRLLRLRPQTAPRVRLVCVPYAGAGVTPFRPWTRLLPEWIELCALQPPGREDRLSEAPLTDWSAMVDACAAALRPVADAQVPIAFYGHSLGALVVLELARDIARRRPQGLAHLFCAARSWPGSPQDQLLQVSHLTDAALVELLDARFGALSTSFAVPEIRDLVLPILRADLTMLEGYRYAPAPPLPCPLTVCVGVDDPATADAEPEAWRVETAAECATLRFNGGHFFLEAERQALLAQIVRRLAPAR